MFLSPKQQCQVVLDRVRHFQPIPIHRFLLSTDADTDMLQERTWRSVTDRSKAADAAAAAATNNSGGGSDGCSGGGCL